MESSTVIKYINCLMESSDCAVQLWVFGSGMSAMASSQNAIFCVELKGAFFRSLRLNMLCASVFSLHSAYKINEIPSQGPQHGGAPCHLKRILFKLSVYAAYKPHQGNKATPSVVF